ncbi:MAG: hypothetical protein NTW86_08360, partial [Candidatus Sumerlaeota bacterium]|nr:hypothetical protein [Candidatus Sumerlaeota bacterium]
MVDLPPLIASTRPLLGQSLIDKRADWELLERFAPAKAMERWLDGAAEKGVGAIETLADARVLAALRRRRALRLEV